MVYAVLIEQQFDERSFFWQELSEEKKNREKYDEILRVCFIWFYCLFNYIDELLNVWLDKECVCTFENMIVAAMLTDFSFPFLSFSFIFLIFLNKTCLNVSIRDTCAYDLWISAFYAIMYAIEAIFLLIFSYFFIVYVCKSFNLKTKSTNNNNV